MNERNCIGVVLVLMWTVWAAYGAEPELRISVFREGSAVIEERRTVAITSKNGPIRWTGVGPLIDLESVSLRAIEGDPLPIQSQSFRYDLSDLPTLLDQYRGEKIHLVEHGKKGSERKVVTLLHADDEGIIVGRDNGEIRVHPEGEVVLRRHKRKVRTDPTLTWQLAGATPGSRALGLRYESKGLNWQANYVIELNAARDQASICAWATIENKAGCEWKKARWALWDATSGAAPTLALKTNIEHDLAKGGTLQLPLLNAENLKVDSHYVVAALIAPADDDGNLQVTQYGQIWLNQDKSADKLPAGLATVRQLGNSNFIRHRSRAKLQPQAKHISIPMGAAPQFRVTRHQSAFAHVADKRAQERQVEVVLHNDGDRAETVRVLEKPWGNWSIHNSSHPHQASQISADHQVFTLPVPANQAVTLTYTLRIAY